MASGFARCFCLPLCKRGIEGDLLFASNPLESKIKIKSKSPLAPLFQRGESDV
jgi:hypothetical protein